MHVLKHGLLAEELLIGVGEFKEDPEAFGQLLASLREHYQPSGCWSRALWRRSRPDEFDPTQLLKDLKAESDRLLERLPEVKASQKRQADRWKAEAATGDVADDQSAA